MTCYDILPSTQDLCIQAALAGAPPGTAVLARVQTAGRGRNGRAWQAEIGNLHVSVLLRPRTSPNQMALAAAVALHEVAAGLLPADKQPWLKWPNDLMLGEAKLGGVLIDGAWDGEALDWVVVGIGLNLAAAPTLPDRPTACVADHAAPPDPAALAENMAAALDRWSRAAFPALREAWLARAHKRGTTLSVVTPQRLIEGVFAGLTEDGRLMVEGCPPIASGEVIALRQGRPGALPLDPVKGHAL